MTRGSSGGAKGRRTVSYVSVAAVFLGLSAFGLGLCLAVLSLDLVVTGVVAAFFLLGALPSFLALWFVTCGKSGGEPKARL